MAPVAWPVHSGGALTLAEHHLQDLLHGGQGGDQVQVT